MSKPNLLAIWTKHERGEGATNEELGHLIERFESLHDHAEQAEQAVARVREAHKPKRITEYNVPVFDEFDSPTVTHNGCTCGSHYYPCPTIRALDGDAQ